MQKYKAISGAGPDDDTYRNMTYVVEQCRELAKQLKAMENE